MELTSHIEFKWPHAFTHNLFMSRRKKKEIEKEETENQEKLMKKNAWYYKEACDHFNFQSKKKF